MTLNKAVYLASPLGFSAPGRMWNVEVLLPALLAAGLTPLDPWSKPGAVFTPGDTSNSTAEHNRHVAAMNEAMIREANGLIAVLDGADVDSGTAAELGFAAALGMPIVGLRTDFRVVSDNHVALVNLQVEFWIRESGGAVHHDPATCAQHMAELLATGL